MQDYVAFIWLVARCCAWYCCRWRLDLRLCRTCLTC